MKIYIIISVLLSLCTPIASVGFFHRIESIFKCRSFSMDYQYDATPCPSRCQFLYTQCLDESQLFSGCVCGSGQIFDNSMQQCITEEECSSLESSDHQFVLDQINNKRRGYNISCDFQNYCDLAKIKKVGNRIVDSTPVPSCHIDDQTIYWRGDQFSDLFYKARIPNNKKKMEDLGTTAVDCAKMSEKKQMFAMSLRRIWEADYKDEDY